MKNILITLAVIHYTISMYDFFHDFDQWTFMWFGSSFLFSMMALFYAIKELKDKR